MSEDAEDKKHEPSERREQEAAEEGRLPRSGDIGTAVGVIAAAAVLAHGREQLLAPIISFAQSTARGPDTFDLPAAATLGQQAMLAVAMSAALPLGAALAASTLAGLVQSRGTLATTALEANPERLDPFAGFQRTYLSSQPAIELAKAGLKLFVMLVVVGWASWDDLRHLPRLAGASAGDAWNGLVELTWLVAQRAAPVLVAIAAVDYGAAWWRHRDELMMTDQEMKQEQRDSDGDPHQKAQRKGRARQLAMGGSIKKVATADVVITNPTHYAVALRYKRGVDRAPVVVAKGVDHVALRIRAEAARAGVPVIENRPIARGLYAKARIGRAIPAEWFGPVAQILALVLRRKRQRR